jgi:hypothetical protein
MRAVNGPTLNIGLCRAARRAALVAQARHAIPGRAGPGTMTSGRTVLGLGHKLRPHVGLSGLGAWTDPQRAQRGHIPSLDAFI